MGEVGHAVTRAGITLDEANTLIKQLYARYAHVFAAKAGNPGVLFEKVYDMDILTSLPAWQKMYQQVKKEVRTLGLSAL